MEYRPEDFRKKFKPGEIVKIGILRNKPSGVVVYYYPRPEEQGLVRVARISRNNTVYRETYCERFLLKLKRGRPKATAVRN